VHYPDKGANEGNQNGTPKTIDDSQQIRKKGCSAAKPFSSVVQGAIVLREEGGGGSSKLLGVNYQAERQVDPLIEDQKECD